MEEGPIAVLELRIQSHSEVAAAVVAAVDWGFAEGFAGDGSNCAGRSTEERPSFRTG